MGRRGRLSSSVTAAPAVPHRAKETQQVVRRTKDEAQETRNAHTRRGRAAVQRARRVAHVARGHRAGRRRHARRDLLAFQGQERSLRGDGESRDAADGGDGRAQRSDEAVEDPLASLKECAVTVPEAHGDRSAMPARLRRRDAQVRVPRGDGGREAPDQQHPEGLRGPHGAGDTQRGQARAAAGRA